MPIKFQCPHCQHAMQLPDTAAGKQGKCPKCSNAVTVPASGPAAPSNPHDEEFWSELDEKKDEGPAEVDHHAPVKRTDAQILKKMLGKAEAAKVVKRTGLPWERPKEGGMFDRYWDTAIGVMNHGKDTFDVMKIGGGTGAPLRFLIIGALFGALLAGVYVTVGNVIEFVSNPPSTQVESEGGADGEEAAPVGAVMTVAIAIALVILFVIVFFGVAIGGILHAYLQALILQIALPMVGATDVSFEKNFRVAAYTTGSVFLCNIVPGLGLGFMLFLWCNGIYKGVESVYQLPSNKAVLAVLIVFVPLVLPLAGGAVLLAMTRMG